MENKPKLVIDNLSKSFNKEVIKNISLEIFESEIVSIIGPSGCGKSTLFNIISGILPEDKGVIKIDGKEEKNRQGKFGYMFQEPLLFPWLKIRENVMLGYRIKGITKPQARIKASQLLKKFNLFEYANYYPSALSGGMKQKVALMRTVAFNSSLLLLDEPFGSLDAITRSSLQLYLLGIWKKFKLTILFTTHDIREALFLSDRVYILSKKPAKILKCVKVGLPRPRMIKDLITPESVKLEKYLMNLL
jgi:ABC-type nitrate/sulfonate/bicarbonate transport system ATPase subunit